MGMSRYRTVPTATQLKVTGIDLYSAGDFSGSEGVEILVMRDHRRGVYKRLVIRDNKLRGAVLYGDASDGAWYFDLMNAGKDITELREHLLFGPALAGEAVR
jgi:nitrite reductase (NADH) large subunit